MYTSENSSTHKIQSVPNISTELSHLAFFYISPPVLFLAPIFPLETVLLLAKGRLMGNFYCFQANEKTLCLDFFFFNFGNKHQNQVLSHRAVSFLGSHSFAI